MPRPVTLFTGQWADLSLAELAPKAKAMGYDGVELACWGDHFEVDRALAEPGYVKKKWALLQKHGLKCFAISTHLVGQAVCDLIDERHQAILPADVWGDGTVVADWMTQRGRTYTRVNPGYVSPGWYRGPIVETSLPDYFLRLNFGPDGQLKSWKKFAR